MKVLERTIERHTSEWCMTLFTWGYYPEKLIVVTGRLFVYGTHSMLRLIETIDLRALNRRLETTMMKRICYRYNETLHLRRQNTIKGRICRM